MNRASDQALVDAWGANQPDETNEEGRWRCDNSTDNVLAAFMRLDVIAAQGFESEEYEEMVVVDDKECQSNPDDGTMGGDLQHKLYDMFDWANSYGDNFQVFQDEDLIDI